MKPTFVLGAVLLAAFAAVDVAGREITFEERLRAQEAVERVAYSHQIGATTPFERAVPAAVIEAKVRKYLRQSVALEQYWKTPVTAEMLDAEAARIERGSRLPSRLNEMRAALGGDRYLYLETIVRATLVDRLAHSFFAFDPDVHAAARRRVARMRDELLAGRLDPSRAHALRRVAEWSDGGAEEAPVDAAVQALSAAGAVSEILDNESNMSIAVRLGDLSGKRRAAVFSVAKTPWSNWWSSVSPSLDERAVRAVANPQARPEPSTAAASQPCLPFDTWDGRVFDDWPGARSGHVAEWTGNLMLIYGGRSGASEAPTTPGYRYDPLTDSWSKMAADGLLGVVNIPPAHAWTGSVFVVWDANVRVGRKYDPVADSWTPVSSVNAPSPRQGGFSFVWSGTELIVWGGSFNGGYPTDGGRYNPATDTWSPVTAVGAPQGRIQGSAVWSGSEMIVWGGTFLFGIQNVPLNSGGRYNPATNSWTATNTADAPSARTSHVAVWTGARMAIWGGASSPGVFLNWGKLYDPATNSWSLMSLDDGPAGRSGATAVWTGAEMLLWGGSPVSTGARYNPASDSWTPVSGVGAPSTRESHTMVWTGTNAIVWGGSTLAGDGARYDLASDSWTPTKRVGPGGNSLRAVAWTGNQMFIWGAEASGTDPDLGALFDPTLNTIVRTSTIGSPSARGRAKAVWTGDRVVVWGGLNGTSFLSSGGRYDPIADVWSPTATDGAPAGRYLHSMVWTGNSVLVWGGTLGPLNSNVTNTGGRYDPVADSWTALSLSGAPAARKAHSAVWTGTQMIVWGGAEGISTMLNSGGRYDPANDTWSTTRITGAPNPKQNHGAAWSGSKMFIWGGDESSGGPAPFGSGGAYDPVANTWQLAAIAGQPFAYRPTGAYWTGSRLLVWPAGGRYNSATNSWTATNPSGQPKPDGDQSVAWTGTHLIVWGKFAEADDSGEYSAADADTDSDGVLDNCDNCPVVSNASQTDIDADGRGDACDCAPLDNGSFAAPAEVAGVSLLADKGTITWSHVAAGAGSGTTATTMRGDIGAWPVGGGAGEVCVENPSPDDVTVDLTTPPEGSGYYYLVRAVNACGVSSYGFATGGAERISAACP